MRLLVDNSLSPRLAAALRDQGHDAIHVADVGLSCESDRAIFAYACEERRWIVAQDTDFGPLLYESESAVGVFLLRLRDGRVETQAQRLEVLSTPLIAQLGPKTMVVVEENRVRIRTFQ